MAVRNASAGPAAVQACRRVHTSQGTRAVLSSGGVNLCPPARPPAWVQREEVKRVHEAAPWSPTPAKKKGAKAAAPDGAPAAKAAASKAAPAAPTAGSTPAAASSRTAAPSSLAQTATPLGQQQAARSLAAVAAAAATNGAEGYTMASASAGAAKREAVAAQQLGGAPDEAVFLRGWDSAGKRARDVGARRDDVRPSSMPARRRGRLFSWVPRCAFQTPQPRASPVLFSMACPLRPDCSTAAP